MSQVSDQHKLRYEHYVCYPDDGMRHEIIDGVHFMNPAPSTYHQDLSRRIQFQLYEAIEQTGQGKVYDAPVDVHLSEHDIVQPDLVVVLTGNRIITPTKIKGTPDLVIEILSPSTRENDLTLKRQRYEQAGVPEYWAVDPEEHAVVQLVLTDGKDVSREHGEIVALTILDGVSVNFAEVW